MSLPDRVYVLVGLMPPNARCGVYEPGRNRFSGDPEFYFLIHQDAAWDWLAACGEDLSPRVHRDSRGRARAKSRLRPEVVPLFHGEPGKHAELRPVERLARAT